jgi:FkbM family methyltransferase
LIGMSWYFSTHERREAYLIMEGVGPAEHDWMLHYLVKPGDVFIEAGAYKGRHGLLASRMGARVILIEPSPVHIRSIEALVKEKRLENVTLVKKALWSENGWAFFCIEGDAGHHISSSDGPNMVEVKLDTMDGILEELKIDRVDLLAMDIEGAELQFLVGAEKCLNEKRILNIAIASYHLGNDERVKNEIMKPLEMKGFKDVVYEGGTVYAHV